MAYIISKRDGPRREDVAARRVIEQNRGTIEKLANHLSGGQYAASRQPAAAVPEPERPIISGYRPSGAGPQALPHARIGLNDRVIVVDLATGRQLAFLGELRGLKSARRFVLAKRENGFFASLDDDLCARLADLDGRPLSGTFDKDELMRELDRRLGPGPEEGAAP